MLNNRLHGTWDQVKGFSQELWGELTGNEKQFTAGLRLRRVGRLETDLDLSQNRAEQELDKRV